MPDTDLPQYIVDAIRKAWPDGVVETLGNLDDAPLWDTYPKLKTSLSRIPGARVLYEREPESISDEADEVSRSYGLFFLSPTDKRFEFATETLEPDEDDIERRFPGQGWIGCVVAISFVAPFAAIRFDERAEFENGSSHDPDIEPHMFNLDGGKLDMEAHYREMVDEEGLTILRKLRARIAGVLRKFGITVIPDADLDRPVPWLLADEEVLAGHAGEPIDVQHAFFFGSYRQVPASERQILL